jgi:hypothetical protein
VKIGLCLLSLASALSLALVQPAGAAPSGAARSGAAPAGSAGTQPAVVSAKGHPAVVNVKPGTVTPNATQDGACNMFANGDGDFCYWWAANFVGSLSDYFFNDSDLRNNLYLTPGLGLGEVVADNSESALNADSNLSVLVFTGVGFSGTAGFVNPRQFGNFNATFIDNVASHEFF